MGDSISFLASPGFSALSTEFVIGVCKSKGYTPSCLVLANGSGNSMSDGVRPLVSLPSTLLYVGGDGTEGNPWQIGR